ncbi:hypothetical protein [Microvirga sp. TS319]|uniref:hypothetical protein n=1 Tax=Microvirga sp. TS319 TaxID=3241165 RepID=UPI00351A3D10
MNDQVEEVLSENHTLILGAQILLGFRSLLWVDAATRDRQVLAPLARLFSLDDASLRGLLRSQDDLYLDNCGEDFRFDVVALGPTDDNGREELLPGQLYTWSFSSNRDRSSPSMTGTCRSWRPFASRTRTKP